MARQRIPLDISPFLLVVLTLNLGQNSEAELLPTWCVGKPSASDDLMNRNINYACNHLEPNDCNAIKEGSASPCVKPNTPINHASYAMNDYYHKNGMHQWDCNFENSGLISLKNPSHGGCVYQGGKVEMDPSKSGMWCIANPAADAEMLQNNIDYACNRVDCSVINTDGPCYDPDNVLSHASVAMNLYYQANGRAWSDCDFRATGLIVVSDPSYGNCVYQYRK